jgi:predicted ester cyclase
MAQREDDGRRRLGRQALAQVPAVALTAAGSTSDRLAGIEPKGARIEVSHMHKFRYSGDTLADLWHVWDTTALLRQLGAPVPEMRVS